MVVGLVLWKADRKAGQWVENLAAQRVVLWAATMAGPWAEPKVASMADQLVVLRAASKAVDWAVPSAVLAEK